MSALVLLLLFTQPPGEPSQAVESSARLETAAGFEESQLAAYLRRPASQLVGYTPSRLDPRDPANNGRIAMADIEADLATLRPAFDGLILYGYHEALTPRIVHAALEQDFRAIVLGIWQPRSADEVDGNAELAELIEQHTTKSGRPAAVGIVVGNEGLYFNRYEPGDVEFAAARLRRRLPMVLPLATSEPFISFREDQPHAEFVRSFGDFLAPNIHPIFDRPDLPAVEAARWTRETTVQLARESGRPVLLKETGFPHAGKELFSPQSQRQFWETLLEDGSIVGERSQWAALAVGFEAFDLEWKAENSGLEFERSWGLLTGDRQPHPTFTWWQQRAERLAP